MMQQKIKYGFTLIELIVTISILSILSTIGFVSYSGYISGVRDTNRLSQLKSLSDGLSLFSIKYGLPLPDNYIEVKANSKVIAYQGYIGADVINKIEYSSEGVDPKTKQYYSYYLTSDKKNFQLMGFLEEPNNLQVSFLNIGKKANAIEYSKLFPTVYGKKIGILTDEGNIPIQEVPDIKANGYIDLGGTNSGTIYISYLSDLRKFSFTGAFLQNKLETISLPSIYSAPKNCPEGFIGVWGDAGFNQKGFCVSKYEMTYSDANIPDSIDNGTNFNSMNYVVGKEIVSLAGKYAIADINQKEAIYACQSMGEGYHLIKNSEWMTIARQIELEPNNWMSGKIGNGIVSNGISGNSTLGCADETGGNIEPRLRGTITGKGADIECNNKREKILFNGNTIWDISGNLREFVDGTNLDLGFLYNTVDGNVCGNNIWNSWYLNDGEVECNYQLPYSRNSLGPLLNLNSNNGMGRVESASGSLSVMIRGGSAYDGTYNGIYGIYVTQDNTWSNKDLGFRCAK